ncbi:MAG: hypothetical protein HYZ47_01855 [Simkania negevensis]|nr:hypothetical protein [Simkania negevensis]
MSEPPIIKGEVGVNRPFSPEPDDRTENIDPEKFKKVLKVDESDEASKRQQRRLKKEEEEGEDEEAVNQNAPPNASSSFAEFLDDKDKIASLYDVQQKGVRQVATSPPSSAPPSPISTAGVEDLGEETPSPQIISVGETAASPPIPSSSFPSSEISLPTETTIAFTPERPSPPSSPAAEEGKEGESEETETSSQEVDSSLLASQTKKGALKPKKKPVAQIPKEAIEAPSPKPLVETPPPFFPEKGEKGEKISPERERALPGGEDEIKEKAPHPSLFTRYSPEELREKKLKETEGKETIPLPKIGKEKEEAPSLFPEANPQNASIALPTEVTALPPVTPSTEVPRYATFTPQVFELFEHMAGIITVQQQSGVTSTKLELNLPGSLFDGVEVVLDQYETAQNAYNLQLIGSPEAVDLLNSNLHDLIAAFKQNNFAFEVNVLKPTLQTKRPLIRRKGEAGSATPE